jgi:Protein of unknown function, DUF547
MLRTEMNASARWLRKSLGAAFMLFSIVAFGNAFALDQNYTAFDSLLKKHVAWNAAGVASTVNYKGFLADRAELKKVLDEFSALSKAQYDGLKRDEKLAFLINTYNAYTIELILTKYPDLKSIKDLGSFTQSPWKKQFFKLLGEERGLDNVEHDMIRAAGAFDEPRIHFAVVCASIGCPALRPEAVTAAKLESQLEDGAKRFLKDKTRNRYSAQSGKLEVSKIFDWYKGDFAKGHKGITSREVFFGKYADLLTDDAAAQQLIKDGKVSISHLDYDWNLNDRK